MRILTELFTIAFTAAIAENALFVRCYLTEPADSSEGRRRSAAEDRTYLLMTPAAALAGWSGQWVTGRFPVPKNLAAPAAMLLYLALFLLLRVLFRKTPLRLFTEEELDRNVRTCFSFLPVGVLVLAACGTLRLYEAAVFGLASAGGYLLAERILLLLEDRLGTVREPAFFRGLPIRLLATGLFSLALFGLLGHAPAL